MAAFRMGLVLMMAACQGSSPPSVGSGSSSQPCIVDSLGELRAKWLPRPACTAANLACDTACTAGEAEACMSRAIAIEAADKPAAAGLFERACRLGIASGCTNYAALVWTRGATDPQFGCARRVFETTCEAKDPFACGMLGRMRLDAATSQADIQKWSTELGTACETYSGFPCRVLAKHLETGQLGQFEPPAIADLLARACRGGDRPACGATNAAATFY